MLQCADPPAQLLEADFAVLVDERVHDVFDFRSTASE
jgi:hypothetical protein